jgi:arogenate dehydrogenase (NADP+)
VEAGQRDLFRGRPWVATPVADTDPAALAVVRELATAVGADWLECAAADHDRAVALISHLPVLVSAALLLAADRGATATGGAVPALARALASSGFADTTRVGAGNPELGTLMARCNREEVLEGFAHYRRALDGLERLVERQCWRQLELELDQCRELRPPYL